MPMARRTWLSERVLAFAMAVMTLCTAGCASLLGPRNVDISREELLSKLATQFPMRKQLAEVFEIEANTPRLTLYPDANRVAAEFDVAAKDRLFGRSYQGAVGVSFGLRYEGKDQTIRLHGVKVERVHLDGLPNGAQRQLSKLGAWLAEDGLQNFVIHRVKPEDLRSADRLGYQVNDLRITAEGLRISLTPKP